MSEERNVASASLIALLREPRAGVHEDGTEELKSFEIMFAQCQKAANEIEALRTRLSDSDADAAAVRELMNVYNLGGWTDAVAPMKRALAAEEYAVSMTEAAQVLVDKLDLIHNDPAFKGVWAFCAAHQMPYDGPTYDKEFDALRAALANHQPKEKTKC